MANAALKEGEQATTNPLDQEKKATEVQPESIYTEDEGKYFTHLTNKLDKAKRINAQAYPEFKGKNRYQYFDDNEKIANTHLPEKKNDDDVVVSVGTVETKLDALLSNINNLNLGLDVLAFDQEKTPLTETAIALEDVIHDTKIQEPSDGGGDEEKRISRQRELLKQGTSLVQVEWLKKFEIKKKLKGKYDGKFRDSAVEWSEKLELVFEGPTSTLLYSPNFFPGDITKFFMEDQPFIFVVIHQNYLEAKAKYGKFENWKYVRRGKFSSSNDINENTTNTIYDNKWRLTDVKDDQVEIILYQSQPDDEMQIIINGVMMLPIGFPLSAVTPGGKYNIAKQVFRILNEQFFWGGAFVSSGSVQEISRLIDEMLKLFVLKTRRSFMPPYINTSGRVITSKVLSAGRITMGIPPQSLVPIDQNQVQGITSGEVAVFEKMQELINQNTVSEQFTGQQGKSGTTATEVVALQKQSRLVLGLTILACSLLEKKIGYLFLYLILENWFEPTGEKIEGIGEARKLVSTYRGTSREANIGNEGSGIRKVILQNGELPDAREIRKEELAYEKENGKPLRKIYLDPVKFKKAKILWYIEVVPKEKESSALLKLLFKEQINDVLSFMQLGSRPNMDALEEEFARVWGKSRNKLFMQSNVGANMAGVSGALAGGQGNSLPQLAASIQGRNAQSANNIPDTAAAVG